MLCTGAKVFSYRVNLLCDKNDSSYNKHRVYKSCTCVYMTWVNVYMTCAYMC